MFKPLLILALCSLASGKIVQLDLYKPPSIKLQLKLSSEDNAAKVALNPEPEYQETHFLANVSFGSPAQHFQLAVHTGSTTLWTFDHTVNAETGFKSNASSTSTKLNVAEFFDNTDDIIFKGATFTDVFKIKDIKFENQTFGSIMRVEESEHPFLADGVLGLGWAFDEKDRHKDEMPILNILNQLDKPLYSIWLQRSHKPTEASYGLLTLGGVDTEHCQPDLHYVQATKSGYFMSTLQIDSVSVGDYKTQANEHFVGIIDSGLPFIHAETHVHQAFFNKIEAKFNEKLKMYTLECAKLSTLPSWKFTIGGKEMEVQPRDYLLELDTADSMCGLAIQHYSSEGFGWFLGQPFLRSNCVIFDVGANRFGFSQTI